VVRHRSEAAQCPELQPGDAGRTVRMAVTQVAC